MLGYDCGNYSIFAAKRDREVVAVENDLEWLKIMHTLKVSGLPVIEVSDLQMYTNGPTIAGGNFYIVVIDGGFRRSCAEISCKVIHKEKMIIVENINWYPVVCNDLPEQGCFQIYSFGLGPINSYAWTTTIFLRTTVNFSRRMNALAAVGHPRGFHD